ncbi:HAMP domain-containing protein [Paracoccus gahaiensis]|uniref:histidine kinase n=1 Tax=Paracoccus gahaiensis TaxID=1706839 RepID=A0A4U0R4Y9_9RHOB|nr:HAMP domain-containing sensor histidine kinase [Paracoccus gahaiensis]TJZ89867.1 HAMP domain-containing protein [Paracoccus gahaiensis]
MRIRTKIMLSHLTGLVTVTLVCLAIIVGLGFTRDDRRQLHTSYEQLRNINLVAVDAHSLSAQIAELFIVGDQDAEIRQARDSLLARLDRQRELIREEQTLANETGAPWASLNRVDLKEDKVRELDQARLLIQDHLSSGRRAEALEIFNTEVYDQLGLVLLELVEGTTVRERAEVEDALASSARLSERAVDLAIGLIVVVAVLGIGNIVIMNRTILRPVSALYAGAEAVGRGDLTHRIDTPSSDELGNLSRRFNQMTAQIRAQRDSLIEAKSTLTQQVDERTRELRDRSEALAASNDRLRAVDASRANFFADISHELRTPLTILRGQAEMALRNRAADAGTLQGALTDIVQKTDQIGRLIDDLLFLARSESGSIMVNRTRVVLQDIVGDVLLDGRTMTMKPGVRIHPSQPEDPVEVQGDPDRLRQAVLIALDNALRLAPEDTTVILELAQTAGHAQIRVRDQGPGFTGDELGSAFTRFYSARPSRPRSGRGLGLGLSIAKWIVDQHDGTIRIDSAPGCGAVVEITMPLAPGAAA